MNLFFSILVWNGLHLNKILFKSLIPEIEKLKLGNNIIVNVADNGSTDGTVEYIESLSFPVPINIIELGCNRGISYPKSLMIDIAKDGDFMYMFDNDVQVIPGSLSVMLQYIANNPNVGCFGQNIDFFSKDIGDTKICLNMPQINDLQTRRNVKSGIGAIRAWSHYSIYRCDLFKKNINFDCSGEFSKPGYGFDDDDIGMQISQAGYDIDCFVDIYCFHDISSSVPILNKIGNLNYNAREEQFKKKWINNI